MSVSASKPPSTSTSSSTRPPLPPTQQAPPQPQQQRIDTLAIKQQLHDALGPNGLPYWNALVSFLTGKIGREELDELVDGWLVGAGDGKRLIPLHNHLLISILANASVVPSTPAPTPVTPAATLKRPRPDDPTTYGAKRRVLGWVTQMPKRDRERIKTRRSTLAAGANDDEESEDEEREQRRRNGAGWIGGGELGREKAMSRTEGEQLVGARSLPPLPTALDTRRLPSSDELTDRIARISSENGLSGVGPGVGKALGAAVESHIKTLVSTHLQLHRSNLTSTPTIKTSSSSASPSSSSISKASVPPSTRTLRSSTISAATGSASASTRNSSLATNTNSNSNSLSGPPSPSSTVSSSAPATPGALPSSTTSFPPNHSSLASSRRFGLDSLERVLLTSPHLAVREGLVGRTVGGIGEADVVGPDEGWEEVWEGVVRERECFAPTEEERERACAMEGEEEGEDKKMEGVEEEEGGKGGGGGKKGKSGHAYDYFDPRLLLDSVLG